MLIYKIFRQSEWQALQNAGRTQGAPIDLADGYIHFSTAETVIETAEKHFADEDGLILASVEVDQLGDQLKWEPSRGGALFPHLYDILRLDQIQHSAPIPKTGKSFNFEGLL
ncbi:MAG: DUF952 domain-containing protein [Pseudomonadota bacterium]